MYGRFWTTEDETNRPASHVPHTSAVVARDQIVVRDLLMVGVGLVLAAAAAWQAAAAASSSKAAERNNTTFRPPATLGGREAASRTYNDRNVTAQLISDEYLNSNTLLGVAY